LFLSLIINMTKGIYLLLGSNLGDKKANLELAKTLIQQNTGHIKRQSSIYETAAWGKTDQPSFFNQVVEMDTSLEPRQLLVFIQQTEKEMGRVRIEKWGQRLIDIDLLYYHDTMVSSTDLTVPHPGIPERRFTLVPLVELAPDFVHPVLKKSHTALLKECKDPLKVERLLSY